MNNVESQKDAVYRAIVTVLREHNIEFKEGVTKVANLISQDIKYRIRASLRQGFLSGQIYLDDKQANRDKLSTPEKLNAYITTILCNWVRRDTRLNGGIIYIANGSMIKTIEANDVVMKALKKMYKTYAGTEYGKEILRHMEMRKVEIRVENDAKENELTDEELDAIPEELRSKLGI